MEATTVSIPGLIVFTPQPHIDRRGFFSRTFDAQVARSAGIDPTAFVQDSVSRSARGVIRGLHVRVGAGENKLVRCSAAPYSTLWLPCAPHHQRFDGGFHLTLTGTTSGRCTFQPDARIASKH